ncbi:MAG: hypothetical protein IJF61_04065 [Clostridia bacterium]|nr:hypothetical protein [Clostridia bacterium]
MKKIDMKKAFSGDRALKIFAAIIAISLWFYVVQVQNPEIKKTIKGVPVVFSQSGLLEEKNLVMLNDSEYTVDIEIRGPRKNVMKVNRKNISVLADLGAIDSTGRHTVVTNVVMPYSSLEVLSKSPSAVSVDVDTLITVTKPVEVFAQGTPKDSYIVGNTSTNPEEITVKGPKSIIDSIQSVGVSVSVDGKSADTAGRGIVLALGTGEKEIVNQNLTYSIGEIEYHVEILKAKTVNLEPVFSEAAQYFASEYVLDENSIKTIRIAGVQAMVDSMEKIKTEPITLRDISAGGEVTVKLDLPEGVRSLDGDSFTLRFSRRLPQE